MGCNHFHMMRENPKRNEEYRQLDIDPSIESIWIKEEFENIENDIKTIEPQYLGSLFSSLVNMIERKEFYLERLLESLKLIFKRIKKDQIIIILNEIIGNNGKKSKGGLIQKSYELKRDDLAGQYYLQVKLMLDKLDTFSKPTPFMRGNLLDVIDYFNIDENKDFLLKLRTKNYYENFRYYKIGAERRNKHSMKMLSEYYRKGNGCQIDNVKAKYWENKLKNL